MGVSVFRRIQEGHHGEPAITRERKHFSNLHACKPVAQSHAGCFEHLFINPRQRRVSGSLVFVVRSFCSLRYIQRAALSSSRQLRYEQAKHVDGLQSDSWILLKCFRSRVMAGSPWWPSWILLKTETPIVGYPDVYRFDLYCRTALGVQRDLVKSLSTLYHSLHRHLATCWHNGIDGHAQLFYCTACIACFLVNP